MNLDNPQGGTQGTPGAQGTPNPGEGGGTQFTGPEWMANLPEDLKASKSLGKFKDVENLARGYVNAEQLLGRDKIPMPKTDAEFEEVYTKLGCPADVKEYKVQYATEKLPEPLKEALASDLKDFLPLAKSVGLNNKQANKLFGAFAEHMQGIHDRTEAQRDLEFTKAEAAIRAEYGEAMDVKLNLVNRMISTLGGQDVVQAIANSGLGRNPEFIKMMVKLGEQHAEELGVDKTGNASLMTPTAIKQQIAELQAHPAYLDASHPEHKIVVERVRQMFLRSTQG